MLKEYQGVKQIEGEARRRWFNDAYFDLIVWLDEQEQIVGFQLCYDIARRHRALTWRKERGFTHHRVDDGEHRPGKFKATPILVADGLFDAECVAERFQQAARQLDLDLTEFIYKKILAYPLANQEVLSD